jgi:hypothetical protein
MPSELYAPGVVPPPHLSPFVDNEAEGYTPEFAQTIKQLQVSVNGCGFQCGWICLFTAICNKTQAHGCVIVQCTILLMACTQPASEQRGIQAGYCRVPPNLPYCRAALCRVE